MAASQAASTSRRIGMMNDSVKCRFMVKRILKMNIDSIMPSRHSREDIRCERNTSIPIRAIVKAKATLVKIEGI